MYEPKSDELTVGMEGGNIIYPVRQTLWEWSSPMNWNKQSVLQKRDIIELRTKT